jgi:hypothetical protein
MTIQSCPHCGKHDLLYTNVQAHGWCTQIWDFDGTSAEMGTDGLWFTRSKTLRCCSCGKVRRDVVLIGNTVYQKER